MRYSARAVVLSVLFCLALLATVISAGQQNNDQPAQVAQRSDVYCTGYIADVAPQTDLKIVGAERENTKYTYSQGDIIFLSRGRGGGMQPGAVFNVIRPIGEVHHPATKKRLGFFVRELGMVRVLEVQEHTSTAEVTVSCDMMEFGDLLRPYEEKSAPNARDVRPLPRYSEGTKGTSGQIVMAPGFEENLAANRLVFLDLGNRQDVHPGDYFTIYRYYSEREGIVKTPQYNVVEKKNSDYNSDRWRGGEYSIQASAESREKVLRTRPPMPRKVVGELVVIKCENNTSVGMITRTTGVVNIGDQIERSN
jgi:hypothetical protein